MKVLKFFGIQSIQTAKISLTTDFDFRFFEFGIRK